MPEYLPTNGQFPQHYYGRRLFEQSHWPYPTAVYKTKKGVTKAEFERTDPGLEAVPGYFQKRILGKDAKTRGHGAARTALVYINPFQRRRGIGLDRTHKLQVPLSNHFINNYTNNQLHHMRRMNGMFKLLFWDQSKYTPLQAHQWNQYLDEHPEQEHHMPIPTTGNERAPLAPYPYNNYDFYGLPDYHSNGNKTHHYNFDDSGNATTLRSPEYEEEEAENDNPLPIRQHLHNKAFRREVDESEEESDDNDDDNDDNNDDNDDDADTFGFKALPKSTSKYSTSKDQPPAITKAPTITQPTRTSRQPTSLGNGWYVILPDGKGSQWAFRSSEGAAYVKKHKYHVDT